MSIIDIATRHVVSIGAGATVREAAELMRHRHVGLLVVVEQPNGERYPIGVLTDRDIVVSVTAPGIDPDVITVGDVMSRAVSTCGAHDDLFGALQTMRVHGIRRLPVVDGHGALCGLVSIDDIIAAIGQNLGDLSAALRREQVNEMRSRT
jgi:CBS domain-containing protein